MNDKTLTAFVDTGSEATIIKSSVAQGLKGARILDSAKSVQGVAGTPMAVLGETDLNFDIVTPHITVHRVCMVDGINFPGDVLLGMDLLRRFDIELVATNEPPRAYISLDGRRFPVEYTGQESLRCAIIQTVEANPVELSTQATHMTPVHVTSTEVIKPRSGRFVSATVAKSLPKSGVVMIEGTHPRFIVPRAVVNTSSRKTAVWVVNPDNKPRRITQGTCIGQAEYVEEQYLLEIGKSTNSSESVSCSLPDGTHVCSAELDPEAPDNAEYARDPDDIGVCDISLDSLDDFYAIHDFGYRDDEYVIFPETPVLSRVESDGEPCPNHVEVGALAKKDNHELLDLNHLDITQQEQLRGVLADFPHLFSGDKSTIGKIPGIQHRITTKTNHPVCRRQWRLPQATKQTIRAECDAMLQQGVIEPSTSPWLSPVVLVRKKDGTIRFCVDYRGLNAITVADSHPLPRIDEVIDSLSGKVWFTVLDSRAAYWAVEVAPADRPKTAFTDGARLFQFARMPFGLCTAPTTFQRTMNLVLSKVLGKHTLAYLDDVVVASTTFESHMQDLAETLHLLNEAGLKLNQSKCTFAKQQIDFLGFVVSADGVLPNPNKVKAIKEMKPPKNVREVRRFLGACGFFRRHIKNFATVARPLTKLTRKDMPFCWSRESDDAFMNLKTALASAPVLRMPNFDHPFEIHTASKDALGAVLIQRGDEDEPQAVCYWSRTLNDAESRYNAIDLEALAVVEGVRVFDPYVYGRHFTVHTDHRPLTYVFSRKTKSPRMSRFAHDLSFYDFNIVYKPGPSNHVPDLLSRPIGETPPNTASEVLPVAQAPPPVDPDQPADLTTLDHVALREHQLKDELWKDIMEFLEGKRLPRGSVPTSLQEFELDQGVLYHLRSMPDRVVKQVCVPHGLRSQALQLAHSPPTAVHPGALRTYHNLEANYYFPNMLRLCKWYVQHCTTCQRRKGSRNHVEMQGRPPPEGPLELVSADLMDLRASAGGYRYVLSIVDHHSRFLQLVPLRNKSAETVLRGFYDHYITLFGPPRQIVTDNGGEFANEQWQNLCKELEVKYSYTVAYHPSSNGLVERTNRVVKDALSMLVADKPGTWPSYLPSVRLAINSAIHRSVGDQPLYLLTGRMALFPRGLTNLSTTDASLRTQQLAKARQFAIDASLRTHERNAEAHKKKVRSNWKPEEDALVLRRDFTAGALQDRWLGPCRIVKRLGPVTWLLKDLQPPHGTIKQHQDQMKPYIPPAELDYVDLGDQLPLDLMGDEQWNGRPPDIADLHDVPCEPDDNGNRWVGSLPAQEDDGTDGETDYETCSEMDDEIDCEL